MVEAVEFFKLLAKFDGRQASGILTWAIYQMSAMNMMPALIQRLYQPSLPSQGAPSPSDDPVQNPAASDAVQRTPEHRLNPGYAQHQHHRHACQPVLRQLLSTRRLYRSEYCGCFLIYVSACACERL